MDLSPFNFVVKRRWTFSIDSMSCFRQGDGGSNDAIFDSNKFKMAAAAILDNFEWPYLRNSSCTIYLYSAHRAVIFAIAQLS